MMASSCCMSVMIGVLAYIFVVSAFSSPSDDMTTIQLRNNIAPAFKNSRAYRLLELEARRQLRNGKYMRFGRAPHDDYVWGGGRSGTDADLDASQFDDFTEQQKDLSRTQATSNRVKNNNEKTSLTEKQNQQQQQQQRLSDDNDHPSTDKLPHNLSEDDNALQLKRSRLSNEPGSQFMRFGR